jgi:hypothetical protein
MKFGKVEVQSHIKGKISLLAHFLIFVETVPAMWLCACSNSKYQVNSQILSKGETRE